MKIVDMMEKIFQMRTLKDRINVINKSFPNFWRVQCRNYSSAFISLHISLHIQLVLLVFSRWAMRRQHFFKNIFWRLWYCCQYVNICCLFFTFITFIRFSLISRKGLHFSWDERILFENFWNYAFISTNTLWTLFFRCPNSFVKDVFQQHLSESFKSIRLVM